MNRKSFIVVFTLLILAVLPIKAQNADMIVFLLKGKAELIHNRQLSSLVPGLQLVAGDSVKLQANTYVLLISSDHKSIELKAPGIFSVSQLKRIHTSTSSLYTEEYLTLIWKAMNSEDEEITDKNYHESMKIKGAVNRGERTSIRPFENSVVLYLPIVFSWSKGNQYFQSFTLLDNHDQPILSIEIQDTLLRITNADKVLKKGTTYHWKAGDNGIYNSFTLASDSLAALINNEFTTAERMGYETRDLYLFKALIYEKYNILSEAEKYFKMAAGSDEGESVNKLLLDFFSKRHPG